ncbi:unnamed protein product (macronuclear) [Paramecium tetraurelia]|uniref:Myosin motor domain-containing protein n=1 Tax=Paramecium tetraurelia TaxID=5888 RepID=A0E9M7_PARTE|nr:uncharacterized protein GSPATT00024725001 [Paramecium tetraurelia]CAK91994.1 unnamed protein product [Paramecium tetraurelia]|eukprot:XP_001459391.1 hypothetical protein (macronuclear) [Paramecium tetraurelia strain d4-2]
MELLNYAATIIQKTFRGFLARQAVKQIRRINYFSSFDHHNEYGFCIQPQRSKKSTRNAQSLVQPTKRMVRSSVCIQKCYRGYLSRKYVCNFYRLKQIVLFLEGHIHNFLRKRIQQRKIHIKQLMAQCYNFQTQCKSIAKGRYNYSKFMNQKQFDEINGIIFTSFLHLMIPNFEKLNSEQKSHYVDQILGVVQSHPPRKTMPTQISSKTPLKQRHIIQNVSVLSSEVMTSNGSCTSSHKSKSNLTNEEFKSILQRQNKQIK